MNYSICYVTCPSLDSARKIGTLLVAKRLAACVNITGPILSVYRENEVIEKQEYSILIKTLTDKVQQIIDYVKDIHEYELPGIVSVEISEGNSEFLMWIASQLSQG